jgi:hypothetical protein
MLYQLCTSADLVRFHLQVFGNPEIRDKEVHARCNFLEHFV